jgi:hypothetical protein
VPIALPQFTELRVQVESFSAGMGWVRWRRGEDLSGRDEVVGAIEPIVLLFPVSMYWMYVLLYFCVWS